MIEFRRGAGRMASIEPLDGVLVCLQRGLPERLGRRFPLRKIARLMGDLFVVKKTKGRVAVLTDFGNGAPMAAWMAEDLIALGAKRLVSIVLGGGLQPDLEPGAVVVCDRAIRDEGTSHHYLPPGKFVEGSPALAARFGAALEKQGLSFVTGATWTTDAPYRETAEEVRHYQAEGIKTVEMETAALFTVAQVRSVEAAAAVVVVDTLYDAVWRPPEQVKAVERVLETVYAAAIDALDQAPP
jgi:uridine phosphorylase